MTYIAVGNHSTVVSYLSTTAAVTVTRRRPIKPCTVRVTGTVLPRDISDILERAITALDRAGSSLVLDLKDVHDGCVRLEGALAFLDTVAQAHGVRLVVRRPEP